MVWKLTIPCFRNRHIDTSELHLFHLPHAVVEIAQRRERVPRQDKARPRSLRNTLRCPPPKPILTCTHPASLHIPASEQRCANPIIVFSNQIDASDQNLGICELSEKWNFNCFSWSHRQQQIREAELQSISKLHVARLCWILQLRLVQRCDHEHCSSQPFARNVQLVPHLLPHQGRHWKAVFLFKHNLRLTISFSIAGSRSPAQRRWTWRPLLASLQLEERLVRVVCFKPSACSCPQSRWQVLLHWTLTTYIP